MGLSQAKFANQFGFSVDAVRNWEQGRRQPDVAARAFLMVIDREPEAVCRALSAPAAKTRRKGKAEGTPQQPGSSRPLFIDQNEEGGPGVRLREHI
jgi:transcriptional regulator with XRE-family HTH domain